MGGGGGMRVFFDICEKRLLQKCMGWGSGGHIFEHRATHWMVHTNRHCPVELSLFRSIVVIGIAFFRQAWDPVGADITLFVDRDIFLQFSQSCNLRAFTCNHPSLRGKAHRPRSTFSSLLNRTLLTGSGVLPKSSNFFVSDQHRVLQMVSVAAC